MFFTYTLTTVIVRFKLRCNDINSFSVQLRYKFGLVLETGVLANIGLNVSL